jgi:hypothetical protein
MMLHNLFWVLVDGAGYGGNDRASSHDPNKDGFPQGVQASFPWEGWWQEEPDKHPPHGGNPGPAVRH